MVNSTHSQDQQGVAESLWSFGCRAIRSRQPKLLSHDRPTGRVAVIIPARDEAETIGPIVSALNALKASGRVDDVVVVDDGSTDATATLADAAGARVLRSADGPGKGQALRFAVSATDADVLVFLDGDVANFHSSYVTMLTAPLADPSIQMVKARYRRSCDGRADESGRVTELLAKPLLRRLFPELANLAQPLSGECAIRRTALDSIELSDGYGIEIGLLIDVCNQFGRGAIAEVDLGERVHRNRPLHELRTHADHVLVAALSRAHRSDIGPR